MIGKTKILTGLAAAAVIGSAAVPFVASAQQSGTPSSAPGATPLHGGMRGGTALATALGVTPEALATAMKAAREATPKLAPEQMRDEAARAANRAAYEAALAANLGITVEALQAAHQSVAPARGEHRGPGGAGLKGPGGPGGMHGLGNQALATALGIDVATLNAAQAAVRQEMTKPAFTPGTRPDPATLEAMKAQHQSALAAKLGISVDALNAAQEKVRAEFEAQHTARAAEMFSTVLAKAVADGKITQAKADELAAQFAQGGDAAKEAFKALREAVGAPGGPLRAPGGARHGRGPAA